MLVTTPSALSLSHAVCVQSVVEVNVCVHIHLQYPFARPAWAHLLASHTKLPPGHPPPGPSSSAARCMLLVSQAGSAATTLPSALLSPWLICHRCCHWSSLPAPVPSSALFLYICFLLPVSLSATRLCHAHAVFSCPSASSMLWIGCGLHGHVAGTPSSCWFGCSQCCRGSGFEAGSESSLCLKNVAPCAHAASSSIIVPARSPLVGQARHQRASCLPVVPLQHGSPLARSSPNACFEPPWPQCGPPPLAVGQKPKRGCRRGGLPAMAMRGPSQSVPPQVPSADAAALAACMQVGQVRAVLIARLVGRDPA